MTEAEGQRALGAQLPRFLLVGLSNLALSYGVFMLGLRLFEGIAVRATLSQIVTYAVGTAWSYFWNRRWTFRSRAALAGEATRFVVLQIFCAVLSTSLVGLAIDALHLDPQLSWVGVVGAITVLNFVLAKVWVFGPRRGAE
jgi:putative flippase GtrA